MIVLTFLVSMLLSPATAPSSKIVLFDGKNLSNWVRRDGTPAQWKLLGDGSMEVNATGDIISKIKQPAQDFVLHVEFNVPKLPPEVKGQERGNSGIYLLGRYEVQVLDSFGLAPTPDDCGAIYSIKAPDKNVCKPPGEWQTYDITFRSPRWDMGKKVMNARISVVQNGVKIHEDVEVPKPTGSEIGPEQPGDDLPVVMLQDHGNPVRFRNVWVAPIGAETKESK